jgi:general secretion pathway protein G
LQALLTPPSSKADRWHGPYIEGNNVPIDPWGEPYQYEYPGKHNKAGYDLWSKGPDKQSGTADDIGNWDSAASTPETK